MIYLCSPCARISQLAVSAPNEFGAIVLRRRPAGEKIAGETIASDVTTDRLLLLRGDSTVCVKELLSKIDQKMCTSSYVRPPSWAAPSQPVCSHSASAPSSLPARTRSLTWQCALESTASAASVRATTRRRVARACLHCRASPSIVRWGASTVLPRTVGRRGAPGRARSPDPWRVVVLQAASCAAPRRARAP